MQGEKVPEKFEPHASEVFLREESQLLGFRLGFEARSDVFV